MRGSTFLIGAAIVAGIMLLWANLTRYGAPVGQVRVIPAQQVQPDALIASREQLRKILFH
ncbi:MAG TPA: hypothetical protein VGF60_13630 [Xanthobacteraceae bacterium]